ncbi:hypothetical protein QT971_28570, partial [Microcoleus sp. herbarium19]
GVRGDLGLIVKQQSVTTFDVKLTLIGTAVSLRFGIKIKRVFVKGVLWLLARIQFLSAFCRP